MAKMDITKQCAKLEMIHLVKNNGLILKGINNESVDFEIENRTPRTFKLTQEFAPLRLQKAAELDRITTITVGEIDNPQKLHTRKVYMLKERDGHFPVLNSMGTPCGFLCKLPDLDGGLTSSYALLFSEGEFNRFVELNQSILANAISV